MEFLLLIFVTIKTQRLWLQKRNKQRRKMPSDILFGEQWQQINV